MTRESPVRRQFPSPSQDFSCKSVTGVGDSLMVGAAPYLQSGLNSFNYKARVGIQMDEGISYLRSLAAQDQIGDILLVSLGSNGPISSGQVDTVMELAGNRRVYAMNIVVARSWESSVNRVWAEGADRHRNLHIVDWHAYVGSHPGILRADGVHPTSSGYAAYAQLYLERFRILASLSLAGRSAGHPPPRGSSGRRRPAVSVRMIRPPPNTTSSSYKTTDWPGATAPQGSSKTTRRVSGVGCITVTLRSA